MEDFHAVHTLSLDPEELRLHVQRRHGIDWDHSKLDPNLARQVVYIGVYDGYAVSISLLSVLNQSLGMVATQSLNFSVNGSMVSSSQQINRKFQSSTNGSKSSGDISSASEVEP